VKLFHNIYFNSKIGMIELTCDGEAITALTITDKKQECKDADNDCTVCPKAIQQLQEYFSGLRTEFDFPVKLNGSVLQTDVWKYLQEIPYGKTVSYSEVASAVNCKSVRAVATIVGKNPVPIIVPCHRVIRKSGVIGKFSLVGPEVKEFLLELEKNQ
jgi:methylated-DNA-[protein]-cysteine S-methyltransferase